MRRKCFGLFLGVTAVLFFLDFLGIELVPDRTELLRDEMRTYEGTVEYAEWKEERRYGLTVCLETVDGAAVKGRPRVLLSYYDDVAEPGDLYKSRIRFSCRLQEAAEARNPHCFDYRKYLKTLKVHATGTIDGYEILPKSFTVRERYERFLMRERYAFEDTLRPETKGLILGILFGDTAYLDEDVYEQFRNNGTAHILAVSGLHVGILYGLYRSVIGNRRSWLALAVLGLLLFTYGTLSAWSPSTVRAVLMIGLAAAGSQLDLRYDLLTAMSTTGLLLILWNPYVIFGAGFQMSFLAICSIAVFTKILPRNIPDVLTASLAVNIGLTLYQIYQFNYVSIVTILANLPIIYLCGYFVPLAMVTLGIFAAGGPALAALPRELAEAMAALILRINEFSALGGHGSFDCVSPPAGLAVFLVLLLFYAASEAFAVQWIRRDWKRIAGCAAGLAVLSLTAQAFVYSPITDAEIVFVDVGQGDAIHLRADDADLLIDGGGSRDYNIGKGTLKPYFLKNGVRRIDVALATHLHMDHFKGLQELAACYPVKQVVTGSVAGDRVSVSSRIWIETLWPLTIDEAAGQEANSQCTVYMIHYNEYRILVTGDLDEEGERQMMAHYDSSETLTDAAAVLQADILKVGHHGSRTSTSDAFLDAVQPTYAVIQVGANNTYGHPTAETLERLESRGIHVLRNDLHGAVGFDLDRRGIQCHTMLTP